MPFDTRRDGDHAADAGSAGPRDDPVEIFGEIGEIEVAMAVDNHGQCRFAQRCEFPVPALRQLVATGRCHGQGFRNSGPDDHWGTECQRDDLSAAYLPEEETMLKKLALATAAVGLLMSTASADYYIVQEKATKKCKVVETRPTETTWVQIGPAAFKTQADAEKQIKTVCVEK